MSNQTRYSRVRDCSTVISMLPYPLDEPKPGLIPGVFKIPAVERDGDFNLLLVERCMHPVYLDEARPRLIVPDPSDMVARSIVEDHKYSVHGFVMGEVEPAIEWVPGEYPNTRAGKEQIVAEHHALLEEMREKQMKWFKVLVQQADDDWATYRRHIFITSLQRIAAQRLNLLSKEWLLEQQIEESMSRCKFCFQMVDPRAIICPACHGVQDQARYDKEFVKSGVSTSPAVTGKG